VTLSFGTFLTITVHDGLAPFSKARLDVINPRSKKQEAKGLIPMMIKFGEIMWLHPDIIRDKQWKSSKPKLKGKLCNPVSLAVDDDAMMIASLSDSKEGKLFLVAQPATSQSVAT